MATNAQINVTANTSGAQRAVEAIFKKDYNLNVNIKGGQPLGRITGDLSEFNKSMEAANARVIAFGASASVVYGIQKAFHSLVDSTVEVQKALNQIQVVLNVSNKDITQFGANLFNVAKQTGQSFETVAEAATLLSRQGLGMEETLKRTNDALVLSRITGMDAAKSVQALTAAVNSFTSQAVTASEVVNKFATVDTQFAIGAKDLPEAIGRVGSSAAQAGVSLDQLIALVTATQVATARGGAVIGNSFKTIFTRLDRPKTQALLESLGIGTTDENGKAKGTIELLQSLAGAYEGLSKTQKGQVAEKVGGVFQINILKAALADLNKEYSVYGNALRVSTSATDDAYKRNEALNQTYSAQLNALQLNAKQLSANVGEKLLGPSMSKLIGGANSLLGGINESDSNSVGAKIANGILSGLGQVLSGPGLALIGGVLLKLLVDFTKFAASGTKDLLGLNTATKEQADLQKSITAILSKDPSIYKQIETGAMSVNDVSKALLANLKLQTAELELQSKLSAETASKVFAGGARVSGGVARVGKASGYIPNFASDEDMEEMHARMLGARNPRAKEGRGTIGGKRFLMNSEEDEIPNFGSNGDSAVIPRYARGYIPNFAAIEPLGNGKWQIMGHKNPRTQKELEAEVLSADRMLRTPFYNKQLTQQQIEQLKSSRNGNGTEGPNTNIRNEYGDKKANKRVRTIGAGEYAAIVAEFSGSASETPFNFKNWKPGDKKYKDYPNSNISFNAYKLGVSPKGDGPLVGNNFRQIITDNVVAARSLLTRGFETNLGFKAREQHFSPASIERNVGSIAGYIFEDIVDSFLSSAAATDRANLHRNSRFDYPNSPSLRGLFPGIPSSVKAVESKANMQGDNMPSVAEKIYDVTFRGYSPFEQQDSTPKNRKAFDPDKFTEKGTTKFAKGYIPNFADRVGIVTGDVIRGNEYKAVIEYLANTSKPISTILGPAGVGKTTRASNMGGQLLRSFAEMNRFDKFILDRAGFDLPQKDTITAENIRKIFAKSNASGSLDVLFGSRNTVASLRERRLQEGDQIIGERNNLKGGSGGVGSFTKGIRGFLGEYENANVLRMRKSGNEYGLSKVNFASGYIPNFVDALHESISREIGAGAPKSGIYVKQYSDLANSDNPMGLGVFNSRDEGSPSKEKGAIRRKGYAAGYVPNFADDSVSSGGGDMGGATAAMSGELMSMVAMMAMGNKGIRTAYDEELASRKKANAELLAENEEELQNKLSVGREAYAEVRAYYDLEKNTRGEALVQLREAFGKEIEEKFKFAGEMNSAVARLAEVNIRLSATSRELANPNLMTKASIATSSGFGQQAAMGLTFLGPILAQTLAEGIDQTTKSGRTRAAEVKGLGDVASYAGTGAMIGGVPGAIGGAAIGMVAAVLDISKQLSTNLPELNAKAKKSSEEKTKTLNQQNVVLPLLEKIKDIRTNAGGVSGTAPELKIRGQILEATKEDQGMTNKIMGDNYNFDTIKEKYIQEATIKTDKANKEDFAKRIGEASESHKPGEDFDKSPMFNKNLLSSEGGGVGLSKPIAQLYDALDKFGTENFRDIVNLVSGGSAKQDSDSTKTKNSIEAGNVVGKYIVSDPNIKKEDLISEYKNLGGVKSFSGLTEATGGKITSNVAKQLQDSGMQLNDVIYAIKNQLSTTTMSLDKGAKEAKQFEGEFGSITSALKNNKTALDSALNDFSKSLKIGADQVKFSGEFSRGRSEAKANFYQQTGFLGSAEKLGISNTYNGVMGKAHDENVADIVSSIADVIPHITEGMNMGPPTFSKPEADENGVRPSVIGATVANFNKAVTSQQEITGGVGGLSGMISDILSKTTATRNVSGLGNVKQYDVEGAVKSFESNPAIAGMKANGDQKEYDTLLSGFKGSVQGANDKLIVAQRELAAQSAKKVDDLIKATIEGFNRFGGGIESLLDNSNPNKSGNDVSDAVGKLMLTEKSKGASKTDIARQDLSVIKSVNTMMGGIPVFDSNNPIFKGLTTGTQESLTKNLDTAEAKLKQQGPGGKQTVMAMEEELLKTTGASNRNDALKSIAEFQSVKATGLRTDNTDLGQKMYQKQVDATTARLEKSGPEGQAMAAAYKESSKAGLDPTTDAVLGLKVSYDRIAQSQLEALNKLASINDKNIESNPENKKYMESNLDPETQSSFDRMNNRAKVKGQIEEQQGGNTPININPSFTINLASNAQNVQAKMPEFEKDVKGVIHKHFGDQMTAATNVAKKDPSLYGAPQTSKQYTA